MGAGFDHTIWRAWRVARDGFYNLKRLLRVLLMIYLGWCFYDLFASPGLKKAVHDAARNNQPVQKTAGEIQIEEEQRHCRHLYEIRGLKNFFCPLCGKKLLEGKPPRWQI